MFLKNCPFCNNNVEYVPQEDGTYLMECPTCKEKGITIKAQTVRLKYKADDKETYILNLMDTPDYWRIA